MQWRNLTAQDVIEHTSPNRQDWSYQVTLKGSGAEEDMCPRPGTRGLFKRLGSPFCVYSPASRDYSYEMISSMPSDIRSFRTPQVIRASIAGSYHTPLGHTCNERNNDHNERAGLDNTTVARDSSEPCFHAGLHQNATGRFNLRLIATNQLTIAQKSYRQHFPRNVMPCR